MSESKTLASPPLLLALGTVMDIVAPVRWYNVRIGADTIPCIDASSSGTPEFLGPMRIGMYAPKTRVLVAVPVAGSPDIIDNRLRPAFRPPGYIICSLGRQVGDSKYRVSDWVAPFTGADTFNARAHTHALRAYPDGWRDYNIAGHPVDSLPESDEGLINELGVGYGISRFFAWLRASDVAGIWTFYLDNLLRIAAYNYEFWHSGGQRWIKNEEGEVNDVDMFTPYPWEAMGVAAPLTDTAEEKETGGIYKEGQKELWYEPLKTDQLMRLRALDFKGYLGDIEHSMVLLPRFKPDDDPDTDPEYFASDNKYTAVLDIQKHMNGFYAVRSAQGIVHEKYIFLPAPKLKAPPEQKDGEGLGDGRTNYRPSGYWGEGDSAIHKKTPWIWAESGSPGLWHAQLLDYHAYMFNWYGLKPVIAHKNDWSLPEEGFFAHADDPKAAYLPDTRLDSSFEFPTPAFAEVAIDHRQDNNSTYYYTRSLIAQLPDGSITLEDGYGSLLSMSGGNITLSPAGDVWLRPGRNVVIWAPDDFIARAGSSVDITASNADVRIKAEKNMHFLAGNSGVDGGILMESRSIYGWGGAFSFAGVGEDVKSFGIILKAAKSPVLCYGNDVYVRGVTQAVEGGGQDVGGCVIIDADRDIVTSGHTAVRYSMDGFTDVMGKLLNGDVAEGGYEVNRFDVQNAVLGSKNMLYAPATYAIFDGSMYVKGRLGVVNGVQAIPAAAMTNLFTGIKASYADWLTGGSPDDFPSVIAYQHNLAYESGVMGAEDFIASAGFSCRNQEQYGLGDDFKLAESRWQQAYRAADIGLVWYEPAVQAPGGAVTRPHPGNELWLLNQVYYEYDNTLWSWDDLKNIDRGSDAGGAYDVAATQYNGYKPRYLSENYLVSKQVNY